MIFNNSGYKDIIQFTYDELLPTDSAKFEKKINNDPSLKNKLNNVREIDSCLKDSQLAEFRKIVKYANFQYHIFNEKHGNKKLYFHKISKFYKAASILILVSISLLTIYITTPNFSTSQKIFYEYYQPYQENITTRAITSQMGNFELAISAYNRKDYNKSIDYFNKSMVISSTVNFYKGMACIECKNYEAALISLQQVINNTDSTYYSHAQWFLALTWLKLEKPRNSISHLKWLKNNDRYYCKKATEILNKLQ
jgi:tetratricopeptide (TPR) repeat protein